MLDKTFLKIWSECIVPAGEAVLASIPEDVRHDYNVCIDKSQENCALVCRAYNNARENFKEDFFNATKHRSRIDVHKITACIVFALTKIRLIVFNDSKDVPLSLLSARYAVAVSSAVRVLYTLAISRAMALGDTQLLDDIKSHEFILPRTNTGHDGYLLGLAKSLVLNDYYWEKRCSYWDKSYLDISAYSNIFFWLEQSVFCQSGKCLFK